MSADPPFPLDATRDLLGVVRALYAATTDADVVRRQDLERIGKDLAKALELGTCRPGSLGYRAAWMRAERAASELGDVVGATESALPLVEAAVARARS